MKDILEWLDELNKEAVGIFHQMGLFQKLNDVLQANTRLQAMDKTLIGGIKRAFTVELVISVGRMCDKNPPSMSLVQFLKELRKQDDYLTRKRHVQLYGPSTGLIDVGNATFDKLAGAGAERYGEDRFDADISELSCVNPCKKVLDYRHQYIAHSDWKRERAFPTYGELFEAFEVIQKILKKYHLLLRAASVTGFVPTIQGDWSEVLTIPWIQKESTDYSGYDL